MDKVDILGVKFNNVTMDEAILKVLEFLKGDKTNMVVTPNPEIVQYCIENQEVKKVINSAELVVADGIGVIYASKILNKPLKEKVPGFELATNLLKHIEIGGYKLFLLGSAPGVAIEAAEKIKQKHKNINICGINDGYFTDEARIVEKINESEADICFVCLGAPKQELFINKHKNQVCAKVMMGLGGSMDVFAGNVKRAPSVFTKTGFEWLYRAIKEPKRFKRTLKIPAFLFNVFKDKVNMGGQK